MQVGSLSHCSHTWAAQSLMLLKRVQGVMSHCWWLRVHVVSFSPRGQGWPGCCLLDILMDGCCISTCGCSRLVLLLSQEAGPREQAQGVLGHLGPPPEVCHLASAAHPASPAPAHSSRGSPGGVGMAAGGQGWGLWNLMGQVTSTAGLHSGCCPLSCRVRPSHRPSDRVFWKVLSGSVSSPSQEGREEAGCLTAQPRRVGEIQ